MRNMDKDYSLPAREESPLSQTGKPAEIHVLIWFDVEEYSSAEEDDPVMHAITLASAMDVPLTFKVVGEKARALARQGRDDVIEAMARHDIGYHTDWHGRPPTLADYLRDMNWEKGVQEFERREWQGFQDVEKIFGVAPICFGQPGSSWAPQIYPALKKWGVKLYLDESGHVGLPEEQPFWFQGMLHVFNLRRNTIKMEFGGPKDFRQTCASFEAAYRHLKKLGGGVISVYYHPLEFVCRGFPEVLNYGEGANTPREKWHEPERRTPLEIESGYQGFERFLQFMQSHEQLDFIDARGALELYRDPAPNKSFSAKEVLNLACLVQQEITFQQVGEVFLSASEIFYLLTNWMSSPFMSINELLPNNLQTPMGPAKQSQSNPLARTFSWMEFLQALRETRQLLDERLQLPHSIRIGTQTVSPQNFLSTLGAVIQQQIEKGSPPQEVRVRRGRFTAAQYASADSPSLWSWPIFPRGFHAPNLVRLAQLQTWTIKPAKMLPSSPSQATHTASKHKAIPIP
jgi:hypothetical protein